MKNEFIKVLEKIPNLSEADRAEIKQSIVIEKFPKGTFLLKENEVSKNCYFLLEGCVRQFKLNEGKEETTGFYTEGDSIVSFLSYLEGTPSTHHLVCTEDCMIAISDPEYEKNIHEKYPAIKDFVYNDITRQIGKIQEESSVFKTSTPEERYLNLLNKKPSLLNRIPQHQIASYIGVTPESLSRIRKRILKK